MLIALLVVGFPLWIAGHFLRARRAETRSIRDRGLPAEGVVVSVRRSSARVRFAAQGRSAPVLASCRMSPGHPVVPGQKVSVRYLPTHPDLAIIVEIAPES